MSTPRTPENSSPCFNVDPPKVQRSAMGGEMRVSIESYSIFKPASKIGKVQAECINLNFGNPLASVLLNAGSSSFGGLDTVPSKLSAPLFNHASDHEACPADRLLTKGKEKAMIELLDLAEIEELAACPVMTEDASGGFLIAEEKEKLERHDREIAMRLMMAGMASEGYCEGGIHEMPPLESLCLRSSKPLTSSDHPEGVTMAGMLTIAEHAMLIVESTRSYGLPPAHGSAYVPSASTSREGSPLELVKSSIWSCSQSIGGASSNSSGHSSRISIDDTTDSEDELVKEVERLLLERYRANRAKLLSDIEGDLRTHKIRARLASRAKSYAIRGWNRLPYIFGREQKSRKRKAAS